MHVGVDPVGAAFYVRMLDDWHSAVMIVDFTTERRDVISYSVVLTIEQSGRIETVRVYDGAHGRNELHRYTHRGGKQAAEIFSHATLGAGMREAIQTIASGYEAMIDGWRGR
jgi:hypothetical protein